VDLTRNVNERPKFKTPQTEAAQRRLLKGFNPRNLASTRIDRRVLLFSNNIPSNALSYGTGAAVRACSSRQKSYAHV
jgi:hypothetical protein